MFSIYGKVGRIFRGSMEELQRVPPTGTLARSNRVAAIARDGRGSSASQFAALLAQADPDIAHRTAMAAYAETVKPDVARHPLSTVADIMSRSVITIAQSATVGQAWALLAQHQLGQAPVVNQASVVVGLLSRADLMRADRLPGPDSHALVWKALQVQPVSELMSTPIPCVDPQTDIRRVARVMLDTGLPGLPVADEAGQVIGFVSRSDILRAVVADPPLDLWT
jgi:CBS-domain-containing membrane protein